MEEKTECKWCGIFTHNTGTEECDNCWEIRHRIEANPTITLRILAELKENNKKLEEGKNGK